MAERDRIPFLNAESSSATLTQRGFKWFFRTTPHDELFVTQRFEFMKDVEARRRSRSRSARRHAVNENTLFGNETDQAAD